MKSGFANLRTRKIASSKSNTNRIAQQPKKTASSVEVVSDRYITEETWANNATATMQSPQKNHRGPFHLVIIQIPDMASGKIEIKTIITLIIIEKKVGSPFAWHVAFGTAS